MARISWSEIGGIPQEIVDGSHDAELEYIQMACNQRLKRVFRRGARVRLKDTRNAELEGLEGVVTRANPKTISIEIAGRGGYNVPPRMLEVV